MVKATGTIAVRATLPAILLFAVLAAGSSPAQAREKEREGKEIVVSVCAACHQSGKEGAPMIGDRAAWTPRLSRGLDALVDVAVKGHGAMPARGGFVELEREDLRRAVVYMFNYGLPPVSPPPETVAADPRHKTIAGTDIYFGVIQADAVRGARNGSNHMGRVPSGKDYYHLNISLADNHTVSRSAMPR